MLERKRPSLSALLQLCVNHIHFIIVLRYIYIYIFRPEEIRESDIGTRAGLFEVQKIGDEFYTFIVDCKEPKACTILLRGASKDVLNEVLPSSVQSRTFLGSQMQTMAVGCVQRILMHWAWGLGWLLLWQLCPGSRPCP